MSISLTDDFRTVEELRKAPDQVIQQVQSTGRPIVITAKGKPAVVILKVDEYERLIHTLNLARMLAQSEEDVRPGRTRPAEEFFKELLGEDRARKVPG